MCRRAGRYDNTRALIHGPRQDGVHRSVSPSIVVLRRYRGRVLPLKSGLRTCPVRLAVERERERETLRKTRTCFRRFWIARNQEESRRGLATSWARSFAERGSRAALVDPAAAYFRWQRREPHLARDCTRNTDRVERPSAVRPAQVRSYTLVVDIGDPRCSTKALECYVSINRSKETRAYWRLAPRIFSNLRERDAAKTNIPLVGRGKSFSRNNLLYFVKLFLLLKTYRFLFFALIGMYL